MPVGGKREGAGRKPGSKNKTSALIAQRAIEQGVTPLEVMLTTMRSAWEKAQADPSANEHLMLALSCAERAAPFIHPRLQTTAVSGGLDAKLSGDLNVYWRGTRPPAKG